MKRLIILALAALSLAACTHGNVPREEVRTMCKQIAEKYPAATLQDVYKTCYQDFFGPGHMVTDSAAALRYIHSEVEELTKEKECELTIESNDEPTGFRHRFVRIDLRRIVLGQISEEEVLCRFMESANTAAPVHDAWADEWAEIEAIALEVQPAWQNEELQQALREAAAKKQAIRHSESYRNTYKPHYRIIRL